jgi:oligopeptide/dipeptide ABC transporter ATP-binding protein
MSVAPAASVAGGDMLVVEGLAVDFPTRRVTVHAVDGVSLRIGRGEIVGLVGESGCGKSTLGMSLLRLVPPPGSIVRGSIEFDGGDLMALRPSELRKVRGHRISLIVQDALAVMNPVTTVEEQLVEVVRDHVGGSKAANRARALEALREVGLPSPELNLRRHAHELSGGMQQRVAIAQALILEPKLIIADEPTTALDVTVQAQILELLRRATADHGTSILFITHDLATVAELCDRVLVMYAGKIVESASVAELFRAPRHPYTRALLAGMLPLHGDPPGELVSLRGSPPRPEEWPAGCRFHPRCPLRAQLGNPERCVTDQPVGDDRRPHWAACHFTENGAQATPVGAPYPHADA